MSIKSKIVIPAVTLTLLGGLSAAGTLTANAVTAGCAAAASASPPLPACMSFDNFGSGNSLALANDNGQAEMDIAGAIPGQDFEWLFQGAVSDFVSAGLMDPGLDALYASLPVYEMEWAPNGQPSGLCLGVSGTPGNKTPAVFLECGVSAATTWIFDPEFPGDALLNGAADHDFKHPPALTTSGTLVYTDALKANTLPDQVWGAIIDAQCVGTAIPSSEVVTTLTTTAGCGSTSYNTEDLSLITAGVALCNQAMSTPAGWVVTAIYNSAACGPNEEFGNTYVLGTPSAGLAICNQATSTPPGYVVTAIYNSGTCLYNEEFGNTYVLATPSAGLAICNQATSAPPGYVVKAIYNSGTCDQNYEFGNTYVLATPRAGLAICSQATNTPSGYVVTAVDNSSTCDQSVASGNRYVIQLPSNGLAVCDVSAIPAGFHVTTVYNTNKCGVFIGNGGGNTEVIES